VTDTDLSKQRPLFAYQHI